MSDGLLYLGQRLRESGERIRSLDFSWMEPPEEQIDRQELLRAQQLFNTRYNDWLSESAGMRWDQVAPSYDEFASAFSSEAQFNEDLFTNDVTRGAFESWLGESISARRVPVAQQAAENRRAYDTGLMNDNINTAIQQGDPASLQVTLAAAVSDGLIEDFEYDNKLQEGMYTMNLNRLRSQVFNIARDGRFEAALDFIDSQPPEFYQFVSGYTADGQPIMTSLSRDDIETMKDEVREDLRTFRQEQAWRREDLDRRADETADEFFAAVQNSDMYAGRPATIGSMRNWLTSDEAVNAMDDNTRFKWLARLETLVPEPGAADQYPDSDYYESQILRAALRKEDGSVLYQRVAELLQDGVIAPGTGRRLIDDIEDLASDPIFSSIYAILDEEVLNNNYSAETEARARVRLDRLWRNEWSILDENGMMRYRVDGMTDEQLFQAVRNEINWAATQTGERDEDIATTYDLIDGEVVPAPRTPILRSLTLDNIERIAIGIADDQYLGVDPNSMNDQRAINLRNYAFTLQNRLQEETAVDGADMNLVSFDYLANNTPVFTLPTREGDLVFRYSMKGDGMFQKELQLEVYVPSIGIWSPAEITRKFTAINDELSVRAEGLND